jgi:hypothetical protein
MTTQAIGTQPFSVATQSCLKTWISEQNYLDTAELTANKVISLKGYLQLQQEKLAKVQPLTVYIQQQLLHEHTPLKDYDAQLAQGASLIFEAMLSEFNIADQLTSLLDQVISSTNPYQIERSLISKLRKDITVNPAFADHKLASLKEPTLLNLLAGSSKQLLKAQALLTDICHLFTATGVPITVAYDKQLLLMLKGL